MREIGAWLSVNGEAIYGTRPWVIPAEGPTETEAGSMIDATTPAYTSSDIRFTARTDATGRYVYAIILAVPESGVVKIRAFGAGSGLLGRTIQEVSVLGGSGAATVQRTVDELISQGSREKEAGADARRVTYRLAARRRAC